MNLFTKHPREVGETYFEHARNALGVSYRHFKAACAQLIHAVFPFISPPRGTDIESMLSFLNVKSPSARKKKNIVEKLSR